jgi:succinate dehydrogenase / fumarate reductase membrane anchor subunit
MREQIVTKDMIADPKSRYGDARASTRSFVVQRVTGAINIAFLALLLFLVVKLAGQDRQDMVALIGSYWVGLPLAVLIANVAIHMRNGLTESLEDYLTGSMLRLAMLLNTLFCLIVGIAGIGAVLKLVFWG